MFRGVYREAEASLQALWGVGSRENWAILYGLGVVLMNKGKNPVFNLRGVQIYRGFLEASEQMDLLQALRNIAVRAPLFSPVTPWGKPMSVRMTSAGEYGWVSDRKGYHYAKQHPKGGPWPDIPPQALNIWKAVAGTERKPECCLINLYGSDARMGMHCDRDEADFRWPVVSVSLGDEGLFRVGNTVRGGKTESIWLQSGDVAVLVGEARLLYHGIDKIRSGTSHLLPQGGRINVTMRVVD